MPELPEVETIVRDLNKKILGRTVKDIWFDAPKLVKIPKNPRAFKKEIIGLKIEEIARRGKNIIFHLSGKKIMLIHQKMTGHLLAGCWKFEKGRWVALESGFLREKVNNYIHLMFYLDNGLMLGLSDLRKFAKVLVVDEKKFGGLEDVKNLGPEPLEKSFTFDKFKEALARKKSGKIKQVLMEQNVIAGIGNIYADEILWEAKVYPLKDVSKLSDAELKKIYAAMKKILTLAVRLRGSSVSDYRDTAGKRGTYDLIRKVYRREGEPCPRCETPIKRFKLGGRSGHYCSECQTP
ncbi:MAG: DNA-formamidopyrimidine glycosylase [Patescibacteria group bacterium]|mgnify:CR=1 FL=1